MKRYKNSAIIGKFHPVHHGHIFMIETAMVYSEKVTVLAYTMESETFPGRERYEALKNHFRNDANVEIKWIEKNLPQEPSQHPNFWEIWKSELESQVSDIDCFFGSEEYVATLGILFRCAHFIVDIERTIVPSSGTLCRKNTYQNWDFIIPECRNMLVRKIAFVGGESTGKSTMARIMAKVYKTSYVEEYGREHCLLKPPSEFTSDDFVTIAHTQSKRVEKAAETANYYLFCDTEAITTQIFHHLYLNEKSPILDMFIYNDDYHHYFLLSPTIEWEQDGTREFKNNRDTHFQFIKDLLDFWGKPYTIIDESDLIKRVQLVKNTLDNMPQHEK